MKSRIYRTLAFILCILMILCSSYAGEVVYAAGEPTMDASVDDAFRNAVSASVGFADGYFDGLNLTEREEFQEAYLLGYVTEELMKKSSLSDYVTEGEFYRLLLNAEELMGYTLGENATDPNGGQNYDFATLVNRASDDRNITRKDAAYALTWRFGKFELGRDTNPCLWAENDWGVSVWRDICCTEGLDPDSTWDIGTAFGVLSNMDQVSGLPYMENDARGYFRPDDFLTVKEAIQCVYRFSRGETKGRTRYADRNSAEATEPLELTDVEKVTAAAVPMMVYDNMPEYNSIIYGFSPERTVVIESDFRMLADMGINLIDFRITYCDLIGMDGRVCIETLEDVDRAIRYAAKYGMHIRISLNSDDVDYHSNKYEYFTKGKVADGSVTRGFGTSGFTKDEFQAFIISVYETLARRYKDVPLNLLSIHLWDEPQVAEESRDEEFAETCYKFADAIWAISPGRVISTDCREAGEFPCFSLAEEGVRRNEANQGKEDYFDQRIVQTMKWMGEWIQGFYGEAPTTRTPFYVIPGEMSINVGSAYEIYGNSDGFPAGTEIKVKLWTMLGPNCDDTTTNLILTTYDENDTELEIFRNLKNHEEGITVTYQLTQPAKKLVFTREEIDRPTRFQYFWITYPEASDKPIPVTAFRKEQELIISDRADLVYKKADYNFADTGAESIEDLACNYVIRYDKQKTTFINCLPNYLHGINNACSGNQQMRDHYSTKEVKVQILDGDDNQKYTVDFKVEKDDDGTIPGTAQTVFEGSYLYKDCCTSKMERMKNFCEMYGTKILCREQGNCYSLVKEDYLQFHKDQFEFLRENGCGGGCLFMLNADNSGFFMGRVIGGDFVKYEKYYVDKDFLKLVQDNMQKFEISEIADQDYTGEKITPVPVVKYGDVTLTAGVDYDLIYGENTERGLGRVLVKGKGDYAGIFSGQSFLISVLSDSFITDKAFSVAIYSDETYTTQRKFIGHFDTAEEITQVLSAEENRQLIAGGNDYLQIAAVKTASLSEIPYVEGLLGVKLIKRKTAEALNLDHDLSLSCDSVLIGENIVIADNGIIISGNGHELILGDEEHPVEIAGGTIKTEELDVVLAGTVTVDGKIDGVRSLSLNRPRKGYVFDYTNCDDVWDYMAFNAYNIALIINGTVENVEKFMVYGSGTTFIQKNGALSVKEIGGVYAEIMLQKNADGTLGKLTVSGTMEHMAMNVRLYVYDTLADDYHDTVKSDGVGQGTVLAFLSKDADESVKNKLGLMNISGSDEWKSYNNKTALDDRLYYDDGSKLIDHLWDSGTITKKPTAAEKGEKTYHCTVCDAYKTEDVDKLEKISITVKAEDAVRKYGEDNPNFSFVIISGSLAEGDTKDDLMVTLSTEATVSSAVGTYDITGTSASINYDVTIIKGTLTVTKGDDPEPDSETVSPADIEDAYLTIPDTERLVLSEIGAKISPVKAKTYDGNEYMPNIKVTYKTGQKTVTLTEGVDYRVLYKYNINAWSESKPGKVIVKGNGIYKGELTTDLIINSKNIKNTKVIVGSMKKDSSAAVPIYIYDGTKLLLEGTDYELEKDADFTSSTGKKTVTINGKGNYKDSRTVKVTISDAEKILSSENTTIKLKNTSLDYTGKALRPEVEEVRFGEDVLDRNYYSVKYVNNTNAGTAFVTVTGRKGYSGSVTITFEIKHVKGTFKLKTVPVKTYNGKLQKPSVTVQINGKNLKKNKDYIVLYGDNLHAGKEAKVIIKGKGNYIDTPEETFSFTILPQKINKASVKGKKDALILTYAKKTLHEGIDYETPTYGDETRGKIAVTIQGKGDFKGSEISTKVKR